MYFPSMIIGRVILLFCTILLVLPNSSVGRDIHAIVDSVRQLPDDTNKVKNWSKLATAFLQLDLDTAKAFADSTLLLSTRLAYPKGISLGNEKLGTVSNYRGNFNNAYDYYQKALEYHLSTNNDRSAGVILTNMGLCKRNLGDYDEAMELYFEALYRREQVADSNGIASTLKSIGETYAIQKDYQNAETYFFKSLAVYRALDNVSMEHSMVLNIGGFFREQGKLEEAEQYIIQGLEYFSVNGPKHEKARSYYNLAGLHLARNELAESLRSYMQAKAIYDELGYTMRVIGTLISLSKVSQQQGNMELAIQYAEEALKRALPLGTKSQIARTLLQLSDIYKTTGEYQKAYSYYVDYKSMEDSISNEEKQRTILELEEKYKSRLNEQRLVELSTVNQMNELKLQQKERQQLALVLFAALVLLVAGLVFNQYRIKQKTSDVLLEKNDIIQKSLTEKEVLLREIHHRVKNNLQFISSLLNLQARHVKDPSTLQVLLDGRNRVNSMSLVHQKLYQEDDLTGVDMQSYIENLVDSLMHAYKVDRMHILPKVHVQPIRLDIDTALPVGLILNELITNAFKYAFEGRQEGQLHITLQEAEDELLLQVADNGIGMPKAELATGTGHFGYQLVQSLLPRLKGRLSVTTQEGTVVTVLIAQYQTT